MASTIASGSRSARYRQRGLPATRARRSQAAFRMAAVPRWRAPFSGPIHRSWDSPVRSRQSAPMPVWSCPSDRPRTIGRSASTAATTTSVPRPVVNDRPKPRVAAGSSSVRVTCRVVGIDVDRVRPIEVERGREAHVDHVKPGDPRGRWDRVSLCRPSPAPTSPGTPTDVPLTAHGLRDRASCVLLVRLGPEDRAGGRRMLYARVASLQGEVRDRDDPVSSDLWVLPGPRPRYARSARRRFRPAESRRAAATRGGARRTAWRPPQHRSGGGPRARHRPGA